MSIFFLEDILKKLSCQISFMIKFNLDLNTYLQNDIT